MKKSDMLFTLAMLYADLCWLVEAATERRLPDEGEESHYDDAACSEVREYYDSHDTEILGEDFIKPTKRALASVIIDCEDMLVSLLGMAGAYQIPRPEQFEYAKELISLIDDGRDRWPDKIAREFSEILKTI